MVRTKDIETYNKLVDIHNNDIDTYIYLRAEALGLFSLINLRDEIMRDKKLSVKTKIKRIKKLQTTYKLIQSVVD